MTDAARDAAVDDLLEAVAGLRDEANIVITHVADTGTLPPDVYNKLGDAYTTVFFAAKALRTVTGDDD